MKSKLILCMAVLASLLGSPAFSQFAAHDTKMSKRNAGNTFFEDVFLTDPAADRFLAWDNATKTYVWLPGVAGTGDVATDLIWVAAGDLAVGSGVASSVRLPRGAANEVLTVNALGTDIEWAAAAAVFDSTTVDSTTWSDGANASNVWTFDVSGTDTTITFGSALTTFSHDVVVPAEVYGAGWNGSNEVPTKNDVYDKVVTLLDTTNIVLDVSPQLGADLDVNGQEIHSFTGNDIVLHSDNDLVVHLGDAAGSDLFSIRDNAGFERLSVNSDGDLQITGEVAVSTGQDITFWMGDLFGANKFIFADVAGAEKAAFDTSGNLTLSGTVDGKDIATNAAMLNEAETIASNWDNTANPWAIDEGGTGAATAQAAIDALTAVAGATNEFVLTKDTASGNAIWKVSASGADNLGNHTATEIIKSVTFGLQGQEVTQTIIGTTAGSGWDFNVPTGDIHEFHVNSVAQMNISATTIDMQGNDINDVNDITAITSLNGVAIGSYALATGDTYTGAHDFTGATPTVAAEVYGAGWNGDAEPPTKDDVYDKIETISVAGDGDGLTATDLAGGTTLALENWYYDTLSANRVMADIDLVMTTDGDRIKWTFDVTGASRTVDFHTNSTVYRSGYSGALAAAINFPVGNHTISLVRQDGKIWVTDTGIDLQGGLYGGATAGTSEPAFLETAALVRGALPAAEVTGTGDLVFADTPTLVSPILGTPTSGVLTNVTGYPGDSALVTTGALNSGSITSGFGNIDIGASTFDTTGAVSTGAITMVGTELSIGNGATTGGVLKILEDTDDGSDFITFTAPALAISNVYVLPNAFGSAGAVLTDAAGNGSLSWVVPAGGSLGSNLSSSTNDILSDTGTIRFGGTTGTNNETLDWDYESTADEVGVSSATGVTTIDFGAIVLTAPVNLGGELNLKDNPIVITVKASETVAVGDAVYQSGFDTGVTDLPLISLADADAAEMPAMGIATEAITSGSQGEVAIGGELVMATSGMTVNNALYVTTTGTTGNTLSETPPTGATSDLQSVARVLRVGGAGVGRVFIQGAGRSNAVPNIADDSAWVGSSAGVATAEAMPDTDADGQALGWDTATNAFTTNTNVGSVVDLATAEVTGILPADNGGTGLATITDGAVMLGSGTGAVTPLAITGDGEMIVGDGTTDPVVESGATLRTSIGVGTGDSPTFTGLTLTGDLAVNGDDITSDGDLTITADGDDVNIGSSGSTEPQSLHVFDGATTDEPGQLVLYDTGGNAYRLYVDVNGGLRLREGGTATSAGADAASTTLGNSLSGAIYTEIHTSASVTLDQRECFGGVHYAEPAGAQTITLPAATDGMSVTVITDAAQAVSVKPAAGEVMILDGITLDAADKATSQSSRGEVIVLTWHDATEEWIAISDGWSDTGA